MSRSALVTLSATVLALAAAGCSSGGGSTAAGPTSPAATPSPFAGQTAREVLAAAQDAADAATSVHIKGSAVEDGEKFALNLKLLFGTGGGGYGTVSAEGDTITVRRSGGTAYMKAGTAFWKKNAPGAEKIFANQWLRGSVKNEAFSDFTEFTSRKVLTELLQPEGKLTRVEGRTIDGVPTVGLQDADPDDPGILYIAATGKPYPLLIEPTGANKAAGQIRLYEWDQPVTVTKPAGAINIDQLG